jgi:hypothetical protein
MRFSTAPCVLTSVHYGLLNACSSTLLASHDHSPPRFPSSCSSKTTSLHFTLIIIVTSRTNSRPSSIPTRRIQSYSATTIRNTFQSTLKALLLLPKDTRPVCVTSITHTQQRKYNLPRSIFTQPRALRLICHSRSRLWRLAADKVDPS